MGSTSDARVKRRKVFYIPGYDPFPPRRYRELYRKEGAAQAAISGYDLEMSGALEGADFGWRVRTDINGQTTQAEIEVLIWSDLVQESFHDSIVLTYLAMLRTAWIYISTGALWRLMRLRKGPVIAALYPVAMLIAQLAAACVVFWGVSAVMHWALSGVATPFLASILSLALGLAAAAFLLRGFRSHDSKFFAYYLMHDFAYTASERGAYPSALVKRLEAFNARISNALKHDFDEVLIVGHSSGAHLAVTVLSDLLRTKNDAPNRPELAFLSLGQVVPMVSFLPDAHELRRDLRFLSTQQALTWVDVTAPGDGCSFALCDPVGVSGQATSEKRWPLVFSAAFTQSLSPARWRALRWRFFRLHFQYLCAFDQPKDYDYFQITGGPITLRERYANRPASRSRIEDSVSKFTSVGP